MASKASDSSRDKAGTTIGFQHRTFHDASGHRVAGLLLKSVTREMRPNLRFDTLRALLHQPRFGHYEAIVELNEHLNYQAGFGNRIYETGEGGAGFQPA